MEIEVKQKVNIPVSPWCGTCVRQETDSDNRQKFCTLFNRFLWIRKGKYLKCRECYLALYDAIDKEG